VSRCNSGIMGEGAVVWNSRGIGSIRLVCEVGIDYLVSSYCGRGTVWGGSGRRRGRQGEGRKKEKWKKNEQ
jgi:hypothetical protein